MDVKTESARLTTRAIALKAGLVSGGAALVALGICAAVWREALVGYATGFFIGALSFTLLLRAAFRGVSLQPEFIPGFIGRRYSTRFILTAALLIFALAKLPVSPVPLVLGYAITHLCTILAMVLVLRDDPAGAGEPLKERVS